MAPDDPQGTDGTGSETPVPKLFKQSSESQVTRAILGEYSAKLDDYVESDVIIVGAGPSGLTAGRYLADQGVKTLIIEQNNYCGGGFWVGGYFMSPVTVRDPAQEILDEVDCPYKEVDDGLFVTPGPHACSKTIAAACDAGVHIQNLTEFDDVVVRRGNRVGGAVVNWMPVSSMPKNVTCMDPVALESKVVIDASGHDAVAVRKMEERGALKTRGLGGMWVEESEDAVVEFTGVVHPGLIVAGIAVCETYGLPRMGPTFGAMLLSGRRAAEVALKELSALKEGESLAARPPE